MCPMRLISFKFFSLGVVYVHSCLSLPMQIFNKFQLELASPHVDAKEVMSYAMSAHDRGIKIVIVGAPDATYLPGN